MGINRCKSCELHVVLRLLLLFFGLARSQRGLDAVDVGPTPRPEFVPVLSELEGHSAGGSSDQEDENDAEGLEGTSEPSDKDGDDGSVPNGEEQSAETAQGQEDRPPVGEPAPGVQGSQGQQGSEVPSQVTQGCPRGLLVRREWHSLDTHEREAYITAEARFMADRGSQYEELVRYHASKTFGGHHPRSENGKITPKDFLGNHRELLRMKEAEMYKYGWNQGLVYYDSTARKDGDWVIFNDNEFWDNFGGRDSTQVEGNCLSGKFASSTMCVKRDLTRRDLQTTAVVRSLVLDRSLTTAMFSAVLETKQHALVHNTVGGTMKYTNISPSDPFFWLHHGHVDMLYMSRQVALSESPEETKARLTGELCYRYDKLIHEAGPGQGEEEEEEDEQLQPPPPDGLNAEEARNLGISEEQLGLADEIQSVMVISDERERNRSLNRLRGRVDQVIRRDVAQVLSGSGLGSANAPSAPVRVLILLLPLLALFC